MKEYLQVVNQEKWHDKIIGGYIYVLSLNGFSNSCLSSVHYAQNLLNTSENVIVAIHKCNVSTEHQLYVQALFISVMENVYVMEWDRK